jgi:hypothetical protein
MRREAGRGKGNALAVGGLGKGADEEQGCSFCQSQSAKRMLQVPNRVMDGFFLAWRGPRVPPRLGLPWSVAHFRLRAVMQWKKPKGFPVSNGCRAWRWGLA